MKRRKVPLAVAANWREDAYPLKPRKAGFLNAIAWVCFFLMIMEILVIAVLGVIRLLIDAMGGSL